jgi:hypothetical protein
LVFALNGLEASPWGGWSGGKGLTAHALARQLKQFGIAPRHTRDGLARGYSRGQFDDAFSRYLPSTPDGTVKTSDTESAHRAEIPSLEASAQAVIPLSASASDGLTINAAEAGSPDSRGSSADALPEKWGQAYADAESQRLLTERLEPDSHDAAQSLRNGPEHEKSRADHGDDLDRYRKLDWQLLTPIGSGRTRLIPVSGYGRPSARGAFIPRSGVRCVKLVSCRGRSNPAPGDLAPACVHGRKTARVVLGQQLPTS